MESRLPLQANSSQPSSARPIRLSIIHLFGWMTSCGVALTVLRAASDFSKLSPENRLAAQATLICVGIAYGTVLGGLALLVYRRLRYGTTFPSQPGHWLCLLGSIGLLLDGGMQFVARIVAWWSMGAAWQRFPEYWLYQSLGWGCGALIGGPALWFVWRSQPRRWCALAACVYLVVCTNAVTHTLPLLRELYGARIGWLTGTWPYYVCLALRVVGDSLCLFMLFAAVGLELRAKISRDWLHWSGVAAGAALPLIDAMSRGFDLATIKW